MWFRKFLKSWLFEVVIVSLCLFGIIYLTNIKEVNTLLGAISQSLISFYNSLTMSFKALITNEKSFKYLLGIVGVLFFLAVLGWRIVWRMKGSKRFTATTCPKCEEPLVRVKSNAWIKKIRPILPLRRFYCRACGWKGTRFKGNDYIPLNLQPGKPTRIHVDKIS